jgi:hypothetical protein
MEKQIYNELWDREKRASIEVKGEVEINGQKLPDPKLHQRISFIKSAIRLGACAFGFFGLYEIGFIGLFLAEIVGIGEELV